MKQLITICCVAIWTLLIGSVLAADISKPNPNDTARSGRSVSDFLTPDGRFNLNAIRSSGYQGPLDLKGVDVRIDPSGGAPIVSALTAQSPADDPDDQYWDNSMSMSILGVNGRICAMTVYGEELIVGGSFTVAGAMATNNIAAWNGSNWSPLGSGTNGLVRALAIYDGRLIVGGQFTTAGLDSASCIASWDGSSWSPLGAGINGDVYALTVYNGQLISGGGFTMAGSDSARCVAAWNGSSWSPLGSGPESPVGALAEYDGDLWCISGGRVTKWDGESWSWNSPVITTSPNCYFLGANTLTVFDSNLVVGIMEYGCSNPGIGCYYRHAIATWDGITWSSSEWMWDRLGTMIASDSQLLLGVRSGVYVWGGSYIGMIIDWPGGDQCVYALAEYKGRLFAGGDFEGYWGNIASWDSTDWSPLVSSVQISALTVYDGKLIAGGDFTAAGGVPANHIAAWNGSSWSPLGLGVNGGILALTEHDGRLIAGGTFDSAGGVAASHIAAWDGSSWTPLGSSINGPVYALTAYEGKLIAGGSFDSAGGNAANHIASWDGSSWSPLGLGLNIEVLTLTEFDGRLIAGVGAWVYSWDGSSWLSYGSPDFLVEALTVYNGTLIAGGTHVSGMTEPEWRCRIASWDGTNWSTMFTGSADDHGSASSLNAFAVYDGNLVAGGTFAIADFFWGAVTRWDGSNWMPLGSGVKILFPNPPVPSVSALAIYDDKLIVGGNFAEVGNKYSAGLAAWTKRYPTDVDDIDGRALPDAFTLRQNYPNPFNPSTSIEYSVPTRAHVTVEIFNLLGQHVTTLVDETKSAGTYKTMWDGTDATGKSVSTGVYLYRFKAGDFVETKKMVLLK